MHRVVRITAPSRLHFGLLRFANQSGRSYGGLGMMIDEPSTVIELSLTEEWDCSGEVCDQALEYAQRAVSRLCPSDFGAVKICILKKPEAHSGLGSGTQLALSIAAGTFALAHDEPYDLVEIVSAMDRGKRSSVGSYGFQLGGLIWESGKLPEQKLGELARRLDVPESWAVVLIRLPGETGLHGESEGRAFSSLPPIEEHTTNRLTELAQECILPAVKNRGFKEFSESIYQYGLLAGSCFASIQGSPFVSRRVEQAVESLRGMGIQGVGQSSWGPTIFAFCPSRSAADSLDSRLRGLAQFSTASLAVSAPSNAGARLEIENKVLQ